MPPIKTLLLIAVAALLVVAFISIKSCTSANERAAQSNQNTRSAESHARAAEEAVDTVVRSAALEEEVDDIVELAAKEISDVEGADQPITPAMREAALRATCRLPDYANEPACQSRKSGGR